MTSFGYTNSNGRLATKLVGNTNLIVDSMANGGLFLAVGDRAAHSLNSANGHKYSEQCHTVATGRNLPQIIQTGSISAARQNRPPLQILLTYSFRRIINTLS